MMYVVCYGLLIDRLFIVDRPSESKDTLKKNPIVYIKVTRIIRKNINWLRVERQHICLID